MSGSSNRPYAVRLPNDYDPTRAYPVVMLLHGCTSGTNNLPMDRHTGEDAILVCNERQRPQPTGQFRGPCVLEPFQRVLSSAKDPQPPGRRTLCLHRRFAARV